MKKRILEYSANLCKLLHLRKQNLITEKEYNILKERLKDI